MSAKISAETSAEAAPRDPMPAGLGGVIVPRRHDLGGFTVSRALPAAGRQMVGPFVFFDQMGPGEFLTGSGLDVRPHPHIGLATVTYLFDGMIRHRDSLGSDRSLLPGDVNWMTAGRGIAHSERTPAAARTAPVRLFGIQSWVALPQAHEENEPAFSHHAAATLPTATDRGAWIRLIAGHGWGLRSPVHTLSDLFYADARLEPGASLPVPDGHAERAAFVVQGAVEVGRSRFEAGRMLLFQAADPVSMRAGAAGARLLLLGGAPLDGPRHLFWNFVSSSGERIEQAKADWKAGRFPVVPGDAEFIPLPEPPPSAATPASASVSAGSPTS